MSSRSASVPSAVIVAVPPSAKLTSSIAAISGISLTGVTVTEIFSCVSDKGPSLTLIVIVSAPCQSGVTVSVTFAPGAPQKILAEPIQLYVNASSSASVAVGLTSYVPSSAKVIGLIASKTGASFTDVTVTITLVLALSPNKSLTVTVKVSDPFHVGSEGENVISAPFTLQSIFVPEVH